MSFILRCSFQLRSCHFYVCFLCIFCKYFCLIKFFLLFIVFDVLTLLYFVTEYYCLQFSLYPHHKMWGEGYNGFALSRPSARLHFHVHSINPIPIEGFSSNLAEMFTSTRGCAEPMLLMCQLKVKIIIEGQISNIRQYAVSAL